MKRNLLKSSFSGSQYTSCKKKWNRPYQKYINREWFITKLDIYGNVKVFLTKKGMIKLYLKIQQIIDEQ